jgi:hypothetical protein
MITSAMGNIPVISYGGFKLEAKNLYRELSADLDLRKRTH